MKNTLRTVLATMFMVIVFSGIALAVPYTWTDTINFNPELISPLENFPYTHDLTINAPIPFNPLTDTILDYNLRLAMHDDGGRFDFGEIAFVNQPGVLGDGFYDFSLTSQNFGWTLAGLIELNTLGTLDVSVYSLIGDFFLDTSTLTANGDAAPVPEPATLILLGSGLLGLTGLRRKMIK